MYECEQYADERIEHLTKQIAGCLTPTTLMAVVRDIIADHPRPISKELTKFCRQMAMQVEVLIG